MSRGCSCASLTNGGFTAGCSQCLQPPAKRVCFSTPPNHMGRIGPPGTIVGIVGNDFCRDCQILVHQINILRNDIYEAGLQEMEWKKEMYRLQMENQALKAYRNSKEQPIVTWTCAENVAPLPTI